MSIDKDYGAYRALREGMKVVDALLQEEDKNALPDDMNDKITALKGILDSIGQKEKVGNAQYCVQQLQVQVNVIRRTPLSCNLGGIKGALKAVQLAGNAILAQPVSQGDKGAAAAAAAPSAVTAPTPNPRAVQELTEALTVLETSAGALYAGDLYLIKAIVVSTIPRDRITNVKITRLKEGKGLDVTIDLDRDVTGNNKDGDEIFLAKKIKGQIVLKDAKAKLLINEGCLTYTVGNKKRVITEILPESTHGRTTLIFTSDEIPPIGKEDCWNTQVPTLLKVVAKV